MNKLQTPHFHRTKSSVEAGVVSTLPAARGVVPAAATLLSKQDEKDFGTYELKIQEGFQTAGAIFQEIGEYLEEIRSRRLYREQFATWKEYCERRWDRSTAWALMQRRSSSVLKALRDAEPDAAAEDPQSEIRNPLLPSDTGTALAASPGLPLSPAPASARQADLDILPTKESQVRSLAALPQEQAVEAWSKAKAIAGIGKQPTAAQVKAAVQQFQNHAGPGSTTLKPTAAQVKAAVQAPAVHRDWERVLEAAQRAVTFIRALQDLVSTEDGKVSQCNYAVRAIEKIEAWVRHGNKTPMEMDIRWALQDAAADLGGLEAMLADWPGADMTAHAGRALAALKPLYDLFSIANMRVNHHAAHPPKIPAATVDANGSGFVLTRPPISNATCKVAAKYRYAGDVGGWTPDPNKVLPFKTYSDAKARLHQNDIIETLAQAVGRFYGVHS